ncbi:hypothetical protein HanPI659440_Chr14g0562131 [Helianthus annuus]|nr:hypothetical protein HanPI659440_Chr14g0562131 [Helianthus annuus]
MFPIKIMIQIQNHVHKKSASILCKYRLRETKEKGEEGTKICKYMEEKKTQFAGNRREECSGSLPANTPPLNRSEPRRRCLRCGGSDRFFF